MRLHDFLDYWAREQPEVAFAQHGSRQVTYAEAAVGANRLANGLIQAGIQSGDRVAVLSKNSIEYALLYFAASKAGAVVVPLDPRLTPSQWQYSLNNAEVRLLFCTAEFRAAVDAMRTDLDTVKTFILLNGIGDEATDNSSGWLAYSNWIAKEEPVAPDRLVKETDSLYQLYTSGTTGRPKGVVMSQRAVVQHLIQLDLAFQSRPGERWLALAPFFHTSGTTAVIFLGAYSGGSLYIQDTFTPKGVIRALAEENISVAILVPAIIRACLATIANDTRPNFANLRLLAYGGAAIAETTLRQAMDVFACDFVQVYGITETIAVSHLTPEDHRRALRDESDRLTSAGRPFVGTEIRIVNELNEPLPAGETGEIVTRGPQVMAGYWRNPEATAAALQDGWFYTGDVGYLDEAGYLYILDRLKDVIVTAGRNVYPGMVENVLSQHPAIRDVAVIGVPDAQTGEAVKAVVVLKDEASATEQTIIDFCEDQLGAFQRPTSVDFINALPRNTLGKVLKGTLRDRYWAGRGRRIGAA